jgi:hypothetical protein
MNHYDVKLRRMLVVYSFVLPWVLVNSALIDLYEYKKLESFTAWISTIQEYKWWLYCERNYLSINIVDKNSHFEILHIFLWISSSVAHWWLIKKKWIIKKYYKIIFYVISIVLLLFRLYKAQTKSQSFVLFNPLNMCGRRKYGECSQALNYQVSYSKIRDCYKSYCT